jgi:hypothetical protein
VVQELDADVAALVVKRAAQRAAEVLVERAGRVRRLRPDVVREFERLDDGGGECIVLTMATARRILPLIRTSLLR